MDFARTRPPARLGLIATLRLLPLLGGVLWRQLQVKRQSARLRPRPTGVAASAHEPARKLGALRGFLARMLRYDAHLLRLCWGRLNDLASLGQREVVLYGDGEAAHILSALARLQPLRIRAVCPLEGAAPRRRRGAETWSEQRLAKYAGTVIVAAFVNSAAHVRRLEALGLQRARLVVLE